MPNRQLLKVIEGELGPDWHDRLQSFNAEPIASASIGQACLLSRSAVVDETSASYRAFKV